MSQNIFSYLVSRNMKVSNDLWFLKIKHVFGGNGPWILVRIWIKKGTFKMATQNVDTKKTFLFITKVLVHSLILCGIKIKKSIADSDSGLYNQGLYLVHFKISNISPATNYRKLTFWNFGFIIHWRWSSWKYQFEMIFRTPMIPLYQHISNS